ncbi:hypothetical protein AB7W86_20700 [Providencia rettgeri]
MNILLGVLVVVLSVLVCALIIKNKRFLKDVRFYIAMLLLISTPIILIGLDF